MAQATARATGVATTTASAVALSPKISNGTPGSDDSNSNVIVMTDDVSAVSTAPAADVCVSEASVAAAAQQDPVSATPALVTVVSTRSLRRTLAAMLPASTLNAMYGLASSSALHNILDANGAQSATSTASGTTSLSGRTLPADCAFGRCGRGCGACGGGLLWAVGLPVTAGASESPAAVAATVVAARTAERARNVALRGLGSDDDGDLSEYDKDCDKNDHTQLGSDASASAYAGAHGKKTSLSKAARAKLAREMRLSRAYDPRYYQFDHRCQINDVPDASKIAVAFDAIFASSELSASATTLAQSLLPLQTLLSYSGGVTPRFQTALAVNKSVAMLADTAAASARRDASAAALAPVSVLAAAGAIVAAHAANLAEETNNGAYAISLAAHTSPRLTSVQSDDDSDFFATMLSALSQRKTRDMLNSAFSDDSAGFDAAASARTARAGAVEALSLYHAASLHADLARVMPAVTQLALNNNIDDNAISNTWVRPTVVPVPLSAATTTVSLPLRAAVIGALRLLRSHVTGDVCAKTHALPVLAVNVDDSERLQDEDMWGRWLLTVILNSEASVKSPSANGARDNTYSSSASASAVTHRNKEAVVSLLTVPTVVSLHLHSSLIPSSKSSQSSTTNAIATVNGSTSEGVGKKLRLPLFPSLADSLRLATANSASVQVTVGKPPQISGRTAQLLRAVMAVVSAAQMQRDQQQQHKLRWSRHTEQPDDCNASSSGASASSSAGGETGSSAKSSWRAYIESLPPLPLSLPSSHAPLPANNANVKDSNSNNSATVSTALQDLDTLYDLLCPRSQWATLAPQPRGLTSTLYNYQRKALSWMVYREMRDVAPTLAPPLSHATNMSANHCANNADASCVEGRGVLPLSFDDTLTQAPSVWGRGFGLDDVLTTRGSHFASTAAFSDESKTNGMTGRKTADREIAAVTAASAADVAAAAANAAGYCSAPHSDDKLSVIPSMASSSNVSARASSGARGSYVPSVFPLARDLTWDSVKSHKCTYTDLSASHSHELGMFAGDENAPQICAECGALSSDREQRGDRVPGNTREISAAPDREQGQGALWMHALSPTLSQKPPQPLFDVRGGILADAMGLGKTVEVIALILANPSPFPKPRLPPRPAVLAGSGTPLAATRGPNGNGSGSGSSASATGSSTAPAGSVVSGVKTESAVKREENLGGPSHNAEDDGDNGDNDESTSLSSLAITEAEALLASQRQLWFEDDEVMARGSWSVSPDAQGAGSTSGLPHGTVARSSNSRVFVTSEVASYLSLSPLYQDQQGRVIVTTQNNANPSVLSLHAQPKEPQKTKAQGRGRRAPALSAPATETSQTSTSLSHDISTAITALTSVSGGIRAAAPGSSPKAASASAAASSKELPASVPYTALSLHPFLAGTRAFRRALMLMLHSKPHCHMPAVSAASAAKAFLAQPSPHSSTGGAMNDTPPGRRGGARGGRAGRGSARGGSGGNNSRGGTAAQRHINHLIESGGGGADSTGVLQMLAASGSAVSVSAANANAGGRRGSARGININDAQADVRGGDAGQEQTLAEKLGGDNPFAGITSASLLAYAITEAANASAAVSGEAWDQAVLSSICGVRHNQWSHLPTAATTANKNSIIDIGTAAVANSHWPAVTSLTSLPSPSYHNEAQSSLSITTALVTGVGDSACTVPHGWFDPVSWGPRDYTLIAPPPPRTLLRSVTFRSQSNGNAAGQLQPVLVRASAVLRSEDAFLEPVPNRNQCDLGVPFPGGLLVRRSPALPQPCLKAMPLYTANTDYTQHNSTVSLSIVPAVASLIPFSEMTTTMRLSTQSSVPSLRKTVLATAAVAAANVAARAWDALDRDNVAELRAPALTVSLNSSNLGSSASGARSQTLASTASASSSATECEPVTATLRTAWADGVQVRGAPEVNSVVAYPLQVTVSDNASGAATVVTAQSTMPTVHGLSLVQSLDSTVTTDKSANTSSSDVTKSTNSSDVEFSGSSRCGFVYDAPSADAISAAAAVTAPNGASLQLPDGPTLRFVVTPATLIVCPPSLMYQWASEFATHAPKLTVCLYHAVTSQEARAAAETAATALSSAIAALSEAEQKQASALAAAEMAEANAAAAATAAVQNVRQQREAMALGPRATGWGRYAASLFNNASRINVNSVGGANMQRSSGLSSSAALSAIKNHHHDKKKVQSLLYESDSDGDANDDTKYERRESVSGAAVTTATITRPAHSFCRRSRLNISEALQPLAQSVLTSPLFAPNEAETNPVPVSTMELGDGDDDSDTGEVTDNGVSSLTVAAETSLAFPQDSVNTTSLVRARRRVCLGCGTVSLVEATDRVPLTLSQQLQQRTGFARANSNGVVLVDGAIVFPLATPLLTDINGPCSTCAAVAATSRVQSSMSNRKRPSSVAELADNASPVAASAGGDENNAKAWAAMQQQYETEDNSCPIYISLSDSVTSASFDSSLFYATTAATAAATSSSAAATKARAAATAAIAATAAACSAVARAKVELSAHLEAAAVSESALSPSSQYSASLRDLLAADVVITTYDVLQAQLHCAPGGAGKYSFRQEKRYALPASPLLQLHWHRVVLDEAQYVKSSTCGPARMAARVSATHRWAVSGTPIGDRGLLDLYGLLLFLRLEPFTDVGERVTRDMLASALERAKRAHKARVEWTKTQMLGPHARTQGSEKLERDSTSTGSGNVGNSGSVMCDDDGTAVVKQEHALMATAASNSGIQDHSLQPTSLSYSAREKHGVVNGASAALNTPGLGTGRLAQQNLRFAAYKREYTLLRARVLALARYNSWLARTAANESTTYYTRVDGVNVGRCTTTTLLPEETNSSPSVHLSLMGSSDADALLSITPLVDTELDSLVSKIPAVLAEIDIFHRQFPGVADMSVLASHVTLTIDNLYRGVMTAYANNASSMISSLRNHINNTPGDVNDALSCLSSSCISGSVVSDELLHSDCILYFIGLKHLCFFDWKNYFQQQASNASSSASSSADASSSAYSVNGVPSLYQNYSTVAAVCADGVGSRLRECVSFCLPLLSRPSANTDAPAVTAEPDVACLWAAGVDSLAPIPRSLRPQWSIALTQATVKPTSGPNANMITSSHLPLQREASPSQSCAATGVVSWGLTPAVDSPAPPTLSSLSRLSVERYVRAHQFPRRCPQSLTPVGDRCDGSDLSGDWDSVGCTLITVDVPLATNASGEAADAVLDVEASTPASWGAFQALVGMATTSTTPVAAASSKSSKDKDDINSVASAIGSHFAPLSSASALVAAGEWAATPQHGAMIIFKYLKRLLWRHAKSHVVDEIRLPPLHFQAVFLRFTPVEHEYYRKCLREVKEAVIRAYGEQAVRGVRARIDAAKAAAAAAATAAAAAAAVEKQRRVSAMVAEGRISVNYDEEEEEEEDVQSARNVSNKLVVSTAKSAAAAAAAAATNAAALAAALTSAGTDSNNVNVNVSTRLDSLRMACCHPQISINGLNLLLDTVGGGGAPGSAAALAAAATAASDSGGGSRVRTMREIASLLQSSAQQATADAERHLARALSTLGQFYLSFPGVYKTAAIERALAKAWVVCDAGVTAGAKIPLLMKHDAVKNRSGLHGPAHGRDDDDDDGDDEGDVAAVQAVLERSSLSFLPTQGMGTDSGVLRHWRIIEFATTFHACNLLRSRLQGKHSAYYYTTLLPQAFDPPPMSDSVLNFMETSPDYDPSRARAAQNASNRNRARNNANNNANANNRRRGGGANARNNADYDEEDAVIDPAALDVYGNGNQWDASTLARALASGLHDQVRIIIL